MSKEFYASFNAFWFADIAVQTAYIQQAEDVYTLNNQQFQLIPYCDYKNEDKPSNAYLIYEDLWFAKNDLIKSRIKSVLGLNQKKHARQCQLKTLTNPEADNFFEENHLLGQSTYGVKMGLFINNECFAAMAWSKPRVFLDKQVYYHSYEMVRFASKMGFTLNGALSKLFNGFIQLKKPVHLMTYTDNDWGSAESFANLGFVKVGSSRNILFWVDPITHQRKYHLKEKEIQTNLIVGYNTGSTKWIADLMQ